MMRTPQQAQQLPLQLSVEASARLSTQRDAWEAYARELEEQCNAATQEAQQLREALASAQARMREREREMLQHRTLATYYQGLLAIVRAGMLPLPQPTTRGQDTLTRLLTVAPPDRWQQGQLASKLAPEITIELNRLREGAQA